MGKIFRRPSIARVRTDFSRTCLYLQAFSARSRNANARSGLIEQWNEPGVGVPLHVHEMEDEVFQVLSGQVEMTIGEQITTLEHGDLIFCPREIPHAWQVIGDANARTMLSIFPAGLEEMFKEVANLPPGPPDMETIKEIRNRYRIKFV